MNEQEALKNIKRETKEDHEYFSNNNKPQRECYVASLFLSILGLKYDDDELETPEQESKVDVKFQDASFQVKELMDKNYHRGRFYKNARKSAEKAKTLNDLSFVSEARDIPEPTSMYAIVLELASKLAKEKTYTAEKRNLDLLIYVTRTRASLIQTTEIQVDEFSVFGWRSVSCVNEKQAVVLSSSLSAPEFIRNRSGEIFWKNNASQ